MRIEFVHNPEAPPKWWVYFLKQGTIRTRNKKRWIVHVVDLGFMTARGWAELDD